MPLKFLAAACRLPPACNTKKKKKKTSKICYATASKPRKKKKKKKKGFEPLNFSAAANVQLEREKKRNC
jgi:hypothetical protein